MTRIAYVPGLDGLRGAAVVAVLYFHGSHLQGGFLGVDLFFVLSGFLITSLLLAEGGASGHIGLAHFWERRARRLLPALGVLLVGVAAYAWLAADAGELHRIRLDGLATMFYVANWRDIFAKADYFALFSAPSPLEHTWSLAIEEQFYLVWPLVFVGLVALARRRSGSTRRRLAGLALGLSVGLGALSASASLLLAWTQGWNRAYYGTDTRAFAILAGAAVASLRVRYGPVHGGRPRQLLEVAGVGGALVLGYCWAELGFKEHFTHRGGLLLCSIAGALVVAATSHPTRGVVARVASFAPLRWLGLISYGLYLYHWPIFVWLSAQRVHLTGWPLFGVRFAVTLAAALVSYYALEQPIRHGSGWPTAANVLVPVGSLAAVALLLFGSTMSSVVKQPSSEASIAWAVAAAKRNKGPKILVVGNSVAWFLVKDGFPKLHTSPKVTVLSRSSPGCSYPGTDRFKNPDGTTTARFSRSCDGGWQHAAAEFKPDYVLFLRNGLSDVAYHHEGQYLPVCSPAFHEWTTTLFSDDAAAFAKKGAKLVLATSPPSLRHVGETAAQYRAYLRSVRCGNDVLREVAGAHPDTIRLIDLEAHLCTPDGSCRNVQDGVILRNDGTHFRDAGAPVIASWLLGQLGINAT